MLYSSQIRPLFKGRKLAINTTLIILIWGGWWLSFAMFRNLTFYHRSDWTGLPFIQWLPYPVPQLTRASRQWQRQCNLSKLHYLFRPWCAWITHCMCHRRLYPSRWQILFGWKKIRHGTLYSVIWNLFVPFHDQYNQRCCAWLFLRDFVDWVRFLDFCLMMSMLNILTETGTQYVFHARCVSW